MIQLILLLGNSMAAVASSGVCDLSPIYSDSFNYSLPKKILESFFSGVAFDNKTPYSPEERTRLEADIDRIYRNILAQHPPSSQVALITAGAPGAGKTTKLEQILAEEQREGRSYGYTDPDAVCLKQFATTFQVDIASDGSPEARKAAYDKWRPGSNAGAQVILANLIREKVAFALGTTATSPATHFFFDFLKKRGYSITLIHVSAPDDVRWQSIQERDKTFIQTTEEDTCEKGLLLPQRINDTFLKYADRIEFHYRGGVKEDAQLGAIWTRNPAGAQILGSLKVVDPERYEKIRAIHNAGVALLQKPELSWEETVEKQSLRVE